jgi:hypothetical protein
MKLRRESAENGDFSGPKGEFKKLFSGRNRIEIPSGRKIVFWTEKAPLSALAVAGFMKYAGQPAFFTKLGATLEDCVQYPACSPKGKRYDICHNS